MTFQPRYAQAEATNNQQARTNEPQVTPDVAPEVRTVLTFGRWQHANATGVYRLVVYQVGFEHVSTGVIAQWMSKPADPNEPASIVHEQVLVPASFCSFDVPTFAVSKRGVEVILRGVKTYEGTKRASCQFGLLPNRTIKLIKPCQ